MASWESAKPLCSGGRRVSAMPDCGEWRRDTLILVVRMHVEGSNCDERVSCGVGDGLRWRTKAKLRSAEPFDNAHRAAALRAEPDSLMLVTDLTGGSGLGWLLRGCAEKLKT